VLTGRFGDTSGRPYIEGRLSIPRLKVAGNISFLVDTGADQTLLMPDDARFLSIDFSMLRSKSLASGIGGASGVFLEPAYLLFTEPSKRVYAYSIRLLISEPLANHVGVPSLLGRDVLDRWRMVYEPSQGKLIFTVKSADRTAKI
jgi:hypothetical protein